MSDTLIENARWRREKTPILTKYRSDHSNLLTETAGKGFLTLPGFVYDAENELELGTKISLSDLNYKILSDTIEREIKQLGIDYNMAFKNAAIAWEIEKQSLIAVWDAEFATIKQNEAGDEELLNILAIEVSKRSITLLEGKTAIELEAEAYKKTLAELDWTTAPYEVQLANAKLLTAQKKLTIIPILQEIITKEQELLVIGGTKAAAYTDYVAAERELSIKKQELAPFVNDLATKTETYANKIATEQIPIEGQIADEKVIQAEIAVTKAGHQVNELTIEIATEEKNLELMEKKRTLQEAQFDKEQSLVGHEIELTADYHELEKDQFDELIADEQSAITNILDDKKTIHDTQRTSRIDSAETITGNQIRTDRLITSSEVYKMSNVAEAQAAANITASLKHLIG